MVDDAAGEVMDFSKDLSKKFTRETPPTAPSQVVGIHYLTGRSPNAPASEGEKDEKKSKKKKLFAIIGAVVIGAMFFGLGSIEDTLRELFLSGQPQFRDPLDNYHREEPSLFEKLFCRGMKRSSMCGDPSSE